MQGERKSIDGEIERNQWKTFLDAFSKRNQSRPTRLEVVGTEIGAQEEERYLPLIGISFEPKGAAAGSVEMYPSALTITPEPSPDLCRSTGGCGVLLSRSPKKS